MNWITSENIFVTVVAIWLILLLAGKYQFNKIKQMTVELVLTEAKLWRGKYKEIDLAGFYRRILPIWEAKVPASAWFIPHKSEFFPIPATPERVKKRINFTEAWVGAYLSMNDYAYGCSPEVKTKIDAILELRKRVTEKNRKPAKG